MNKEIIKSLLNSESNDFYENLEKFSAVLDELEVENKEGVLYISDHTLGIKNIYCDIQGQIQYHKNFFYKNSIYKDNLFKAIGLKRTEAKPIVQDLTAGLLGDSLLLSICCEKVVAYERNPIVYALSKSALLQSPCNIELHYGEYSGVEDILYYDPMYSDPNKKTAPKKEMQLLRKILMSEEDSLQFLEGLKYKRLIIKRPLKAPLIKINPQIQFKGKSTRYDVYLK